MNNTQDFSQALVDALRKAEDKSKPKEPNLSVPNFKQEVVISVPNSFISENKNGARDFIKKAGEINRNNSLNLPIEVEKEGFTNTDGEADVMLNIVAKYSRETDIYAVENYLRTP